MPRQNGIWVALGIAVLVVFVTPAAAFAQDLVVTTTQDGGDGKCDGTCTLRDAVTEAGVRPGNPTVVLKADRYALSQGQLVLGGAFTIEGAGVAGDDDRFQRRRPRRLRVRQAPRSRSTT